MRHRAFTLVEIVIVVLIIGILMAIATPQWFKAREAARKRSCLANLRQIAAAKEQFAMEEKLSDGAPVTQGDLWPAYLKGSAFPSCPTAGTYTIGNVGQDPVCSIHGAN